MDSLNVSYTLNTLGPWADPLLAGIGGSAASLNMLEPLSSALPVIKDSPGAFSALPVLGQAFAKETDDSPTVGGKAGPRSIIDTLKEIYDPYTLGQQAGGAIREAAGVSPATAKATSQQALKVGVVVLVGMLLVGFGLWILLYPVAKPIVVDAARAAA